MRPKISLNDGKHKLVVAEQGERILTPEQNRAYEKQHPTARREPMKADVYGDKLPMYQDGGVVGGSNTGGGGPTPPPPPPPAKKDKPQPPKLIPMKDDSEMLPATLLNQEAFDKGGEVKANPSIAEKISNRATELYHQAKTLFAPVGNEVEGLKQKQQQIDQWKGATATPSTEMPQRGPTGTPAQRQYGSRPGEQRLQFDSQGNTVAPAASSGMKVRSQTAPVYDEGGVVTGKEDDPDKIAAYKQAEAEIMNEQKLGHGTKMGREENTRQIGEPQADTEPARPTDKITAPMNTDNAPMKGPDMNTNNAPVEGPIPTEVSTRPKLAAPLSTAMKQRDIPTPVSSGTTDHPNAPQEGGDLQPDLASLRTKENTPALPTPEMKLVQQDADDAMRKGNLVKLGMANINARMLTAPYMTLDKEGKSKEEQLGGPLKQVEPTAPTARENIVNQKAALKDKMINGKTEQERFQAEKELADLNRRTPLGSPGSSMPGIGGKILHGLSQVGQAAFRPTAPYLAEYIPGSRANIARQEGIGERGVEEAQKTQMGAADIAAKQAQPEIATEKLAIAKEKEDLAARQGEFKKDAAGNLVAVPYEQMTPQQQANYDKANSTAVLNEAKAHEQEAKAVLDKYKADPNNPQNQAALQKVQLEGKRVAIASAAQGTRNAQFLADYYGVDEEGNPIPGAAMTAEGKPIGPKMAKGGEAGGKIFDKYSPQIDKDAAPYVAAYQRSGLLVENLKAKTKQADALVAPELLSIAAGGAGSGLRMNEAEITRVIGGRSAWDAFAAKANKVIENGGTFDDAQRAQLSAIANYINARNSAEVYVYKMGREAMLAAKEDAGKVREVYEHMQETAADIAGKGIIPPGQEAKVGDYVIHGQQVVKVTSVKDGKTEGKVVSF